MVPRPLRLWLGVSLALLVGSMALPVPASADGPVDVRSGQPAIHLHTGTFVPSARQGPSVAVESAAPALTKGSHLFLVQFSGPIQDGWRADLERAGARILDYIPDYAFKIEINETGVERLSHLPGVVWVGPYRPEYRLSPEFVSEPLLSRDKDTQILRIDLALPPGDDLLASLEALGARVVGQEGSVLAVEAESKHLLAIAARPGVRWVGPLRIARVQNDVATREISATLAWDAGYSGEGQIINIADTGLDTGVDYPQIAGDMHRDLDNRVVGIRSWPISPLYYQFLNNPLADDRAGDKGTGHGTHVAGSAAGNGFMSGGRVKGVAYRSMLTFQALEQYCDLTSSGEIAMGPDGYYLVGIPADLNDLYQEAYDWGARVHNNSWGFDESLGGSYTVSSRQTDRFVWEHPDMAIVFVAGNEARDANGDGMVDSGSIVPPATAKNVIAVGATENRRPQLVPVWPFTTYGQYGGTDFLANPLRDDTLHEAGLQGMVGFSGRGPTQDGRIAPHVVAPGTWIASTRSSQMTDFGLAWDMIDANYMYLGGTSMSTPLVAGTLALVRQAYIARGHTPSAALLKATLIQTAVDIPGQYPQPYGEAGPIHNDAEGWGAVNVQAAVAPGRQFVDSDAELRTGQVVTFTYAASVATEPARFTLVWTDYPAALEAARQLVNDLDLEVVAPDGSRYRGNVLSGGWSTTGGAADRVNNVECVYLRASQAGTYKVVVRGHNVPQGPQDFALLGDLPLAVVTSRLRLPLVMQGYHVLAPTPTPTLETTPTLPTTTLTPVVTVTPTATVRTTATATLTQTLATTATQSAAASATPSNSTPATPTPSAEPTATLTHTPISSPTRTTQAIPTATPTSTPRPTATLTASATATPIRTSSPTQTNTPTPTVEPASTQTHTQTASPIPTRTSTPTGQGTVPPSG